MTGKKYKWRFGEILVQNGWISWEQLEKALEIQKKTEEDMRDVLLEKGFLSKKKSQVLHLGEILVKHRWVTWDDLSECLRLQQETGRVIGEILLSKGYVTEKNLYHALAIQFDRTFVDLEKVTIPQEVIQKVPKRLAEEHNLMPLLYRNPVVFIAVSDPLEMKGEHEVQKLFPDCEVKSAIASPADVRKAIQQYYGK